MSGGRSFQKKADSNQPERQEGKNQENVKSCKPKQESALKKKAWSTESKSTKGPNDMRSQEGPGNLTMVAMRAETRLQ